MHCFITDQPKTWVLWIPWAEYLYNIVFHSSAGTTPFKVVYERVVPKLTKSLLGETKFEAMRSELVDKDE